MTPASVFAKQDSASNAQEELPQDSLNITNQPFVLNCPEPAHGTTGYGLSSGMAATLRRS
jgi:hypothetical protein